MMSLYFKIFTSIMKQESKSLLKEVRSDTGREASGEAISICYHPLFLDSGNFLQNILVGPRKCFV